MSTFAERYSKILNDNHLKPVDVIKKTGLSKDIVYNVTSEKTAKKYDEIEKLFTVCETPEQIVELATGKHLPSDTSPPAPNYQEEMLSVIHTLLKSVSELTREVKELKTEIAHMREVNKSSQVMLRQKVPETH